MGPVANRTRVSREGKEARPGAKLQGRGCRPAVPMERRLSAEGTALRTCMQYGHNLRLGC